jgi:hypothetical protein
LTGVIRTAASQLWSDRRTAKPGRVIGEKFAIATGCASGFFLAAAVPSTDPLKPGILMWHMAGGMVVLAALFHPFLLKDGLLRWMWFGQRA